MQTQVVKLIEFVPTKSHHTLFLRPSLTLFCKYNPQVSKAWKFVWKKEGGIMKLGRIEDIYYYCIDGFYRVSPVGN